MSLIPDFKGSTMLQFLTHNVARGSTIYTDGLIKSFTGLPEAGFKHVARIQPLRSELRKGAASVVPLADRAIGNLQQWLIGTYHGVSKPQLRSTSMSSSFGSIVAKHRQPPFRRSWVWEPPGNQRSTSKFAEAETSTARYSGLLKQPDNESRLVPGGWPKIWPELTAVVRP
jgi:hypothetical protein